MSNYHFITTMSRDYYDIIGHKMIETFNKFLPSKLDVYSEDKLPCSTIDLNNERLTTYLSDLGETRARAFAYKAYALIDAYKKEQKKYLVFLDADMVCFKDLDENFLDSLIGDNLIVYIGVTHKKYGSHCDSCFFILNTQHKFYQTFTRLYEEIYETRQILDKNKFVKPNDSYVLAECIKIAEQQGHKCIDLHPERTGLSPVAETVLGTHIRHFKAGRKINEEVLKHIDKAIGGMQKKKDHARVLEIFDRRVRVK